MLIIKAVLNSQNAIAYLACSKNECLESLTQHTFVFDLFRDNNPTQERSLLFPRV